MLSRQEEMRERHETLQNDLSVQRQQQREREERRGTFAPDQSLPNQGTTFHQHALADAETPRGRFTAHERSTVVGAQPTIDYPAASPHQADPCGPERPLGYRIDALSDDPGLPPAQGVGPAPDAPSSLSSPLVVERGAGLSSELGPTHVSAQATDPTSTPTAPPVAERDVGSSLRRRKL
jgi:hypothetical protein